MKIERVDDKTVKCFLSNEELAEYEIDYKDFVTRSEKAKEVVQEIMEAAQIEVGYKPPKFAFDLQIMMVPEQGMVLTFSEKEPIDLKDGERLIQCLNEMKKLLQKNNSQKEQPMLNAAEDHPVEEQVAKGKTVTKKQVPEFAIFAFRSPGRVMEYASVLPKNLRVKTSLYCMNDLYYLYMQKGSASYDRYSRACVQALEFGSLFGAEEERLDYLEEHGKCLIEEGALKKLRLN